MNHPKGSLIVVKCVMCPTRFEAHRNCQLVKEGRTYCEKHSVLRGPAWWLIYKKALSPERAEGANSETWREAEREYQASKEAMKRPTDEEIRKRIAEIDADECFHYEGATTFENAPLALIQLAMETEVRALAWVLGEKPPRPGKER